MFHYPRPQLVHHARLLCPFRPHALLLDHSHEGSYRQDTGKNVMPKSTSMRLMCLVVVVVTEFGWEIDWLHLPPVNKCILCRSTRYSKRDSYRLL